jgi:hypothetical protein
MAALLGAPFHIVRGFAPKSRVLLPIYLPFVAAAVCVALIALAILGVLVAAALDWLGIDPMPNYDADVIEFGEWAWFAGYGVTASLLAAATVALIEEWGDWRRDVERLKWDRRRHEEDLRERRAARTRAEDRPPRT